MSKIPYGTRLVSSSSDIISISSFNLLAPLYVRPIDQRTGEIQPFAAFEWVKDDDLLRDETRLPRLLTCLENCGTDFICVQELQLERGSGEDVGSCSDKPRPFVLPSWIKPLLAKYQVILPSQQQLDKIAERNRRVLLADVAVTNGIFYMTDKWVTASCNKLSAGQDEHTNTCITQAFRSVDSDASIVISSIHLDASREEQRVAQIQRCLGQTASFSSHHPYTLPLIIAGDYNCEISIGSCVSAFIANDVDDNSSSSPPKEEEDKELMEKYKLQECAAALRIPSTSVTSHQLKQWHSLYDDVENYVYDNCWVLRRTKTGPTRMAVDHDESNDSSSTQSAELSLKPWMLDHFVYTSNTLEAIKYWSTLEDDAESAKTGLPNERVPTDHLPLSAMFKIHPHPQLDDVLRKQLLASLEELESKQNDDTRATNEAIDKEKIDLEEKLELKNQGIEEENPRRKKKPHPDMIQHIRQSRALKKQLKQTQTEEREQFVSGKCVLERMELQHALEMTCNEWVEKGRAK